MNFKELRPKNILSVCSRKFIFFGFVLLLAGCSHDPSKVGVKELRTPPRVTSGSHIVRQGETLFSIAWLYSRDFKELASRNGIPAPYKIFPGQHIDLSAFRSKPKAVARRNTSYSPPPSPVAPPSSTGVVKKSPSPSRPKSTPSPGVLTWNWPASGKVISKYSASGNINKGIDIGGDLGEPVRAAAGGEVVYSGSELTGYGKLIIMKHNNSYLSAYAHNKELLVREGDSVKAGQKIAEIGSTGTTEPKLHFEIRQNGKPVDPMRFLPRR